MVMDPAAPLPPGCRKGRRLGVGLWAPGARLTASFQGLASSGLGVEVYVTGGADFTRFGDAGGRACATIAARYAAANYAQSTCGSDAFDIGWSAGGGTRFEFGNRPVGLDFSVLYSQQGGPTLMTAGMRSSGNLFFELDSTLEFNQTNIRVGPTLPIGDRMMAVPLVNFGLWTANHSYKDRDELHMTIRIGFEVRTFRFRKG